MASQPSSSRPSSEEVRLLGQMAGLAFQFGTEIIAGLLLGWGFDALFGTSPWGVLTGTLAGIAVGMLHLIRRAVRINREMPEVKRPPGGWKSGRWAGEGRSESEEPPLDPEFEEALDHEHWKKLQDSKLQGGDENDHARDDPGKANRPARRPPERGREGEG